MKINLKELNPGTWFDFPEDEDKGRICLRIASSGLNSKIRSETISSKWEIVDGSQVRNVNINQAKQDSMLWDYCIVDWENLFEDDGITPIECNLENKVRLMSEHRNFAAFVEKCFNEINKANDEYDEYLEKNSQTT